MTWREEIGNAEMSMLPRRDRTRFRCVLRPSVAYRKSRAASRLQFFAVASAAIRETIGSPFFHRQKKKERLQEKHANGTAESGVFLLPSLPRAIITPSSLESAFRYAKIVSIEIAKLIF